MSAPPLWRSLWPLRAIWLLTPVLAGPGLADALAERSRSVQVVGSVLAWAIWGLALLAMLVPRTVTLTVVRLAVPGAVAVSVWTATAEGSAWAAVGLAAGLVALFALAGPGVSDAFVDGSSYGSERRVALRVPTAVLLGPAALAWTVTAAAVTAGPLLLATQQWLAGGAATVVGLPAIAVVARQMHLLSRRWLVFVPAGIVVHDPLTLTEPVLVPRHVVSRLGPALASSAGLDITGGALGLALEISTSEPLGVGLRRGRRRDERTDVTALLVTPTQPGTTLALAEERRLPVG